MPEWSHWVMKIEVDFGNEIGKKTAFAGIMKFFKPEDLEDKQFPFIVNLEPKTIGPKKELSECMMLMATPSHEASEGQAVPKDNEETPPVLFNLQKEVPNGTRVR